MENETLSRRLTRFFIGLALLGLFIATMIMAPVPKWLGGDLIANNLDSDIEATAIFYQDLDRMPAIEQRLERLKAEK